MKVGEDDKMKKFFLKIFLIYIFIILLINARNIPERPKRPKQVREMRPVSPEKDKNPELPELPEYVSNDVRFLFRQAYISALTKDIENAENSIFVVMFLVRYSGASNDVVLNLVNKIISAQEREIDIEIFLDSNIKDGNTPTNKPAYEQLKRNEVNVKLNRSRKWYHTKLIIIDNKIIYTGSHNWTANAFYQNEEASIRIVSEEMAEYIKKNLQLNKNHFR